MSKTSKEYWKEREYYNLLKSKKQDEDFVNTKIQSIYDTLLTNINREIRGQVLGFARRNEISYEEARKLISKTDVDEYKAHSAQWHYSPEIDHILKESTKVLVDWINQGKGPFSQAYVDLWYRRYQELLHRRA